jgi:hypothetical protein
MGGGGRRGPDRERFGSARRRRIPARLLGTDYKIPLGKLAIALRTGAYLKTATEDLASIAPTDGLGLRAYDFDLDLAHDASPKTENVEAADDQYNTTRLNASLMNSSRREF